MSKTINDGGPAFPVLDQHSDNRIAQVADGMTLRDYFAAKALSGVMVNAQALDSFSKEQREYLFTGVASLMYEAADAMLKAREVQT